MFEETTTHCLYVTPQVVKEPRKKKAAKGPRRSARQKEVSMMVQTWRVASGKAVTLTPRAVMVVMAVSTIGVMVGTGLFCMIGCVGTLLGPSPSATVVPKIS